MNQFVEAIHFLCACFSAFGVNFYRGPLLHSHMKQIYLAKAGNGELLREKQREQDRAAKREGEGERKGDRRSSEGSSSGFIQPLMLTGSHVKS